jgi:hypothetical protein
LADRPDQARVRGPAGHAGRLGASLAGTKVRCAFRRVPEAVPSRRWLAGMTPRCRVYPWHHT